MSLRPSELAPNLWLGERVSIAGDVEIGANVVVLDDVTVEAGARLDHGAVLGRPMRANRRSRSPRSNDGHTLIEAEATVCPYALVAVGVRMGPHSFLGDHAHLNPGARLGTDAAVGSSSGIGRRVTVGDRTRIQNLVMIGPDVVIEEDCFLGPAVQILTGRKMTTADRPGPPLLRRGCQVGAAAVIMPGVEIGEGAVVGAGAVVTGDVAAGEVVSGVPARVSLAPADAGAAAPSS